MASCSSSIFGSSSQGTIKIVGSDVIAVMGSETMEKLGLGDLRIPYKQILKSRILLKEGQTNYLLNHLGLGDNATLLIIKAIYNSKSVNEPDNYIQYSYYDDLTKSYYMGQLLILSGNSTHRIPQLYLTNPNTKYPVSLEVMVAVIDDTYTYFNDTVNQSGTSFVNLEYTDIKTHIVDETIMIVDSNSNPLIYLTLSDIQSIEKSGTILILDDSSLGTIFLQFKTEYDADQANSLLNYVLNNSNVNLNTLSPLEDDVVPIIYFNSDVSGNWISFNGSTAGVPYNTSNGLTFSVDIPYSIFGTASISINSLQLLDVLVDYSEDNRDGIIVMTSSNVYLTSTSSGTVSVISATGSYQYKFNLSDIAGNVVDANTVVNINIID
jgi:hypothetical protein